MDVTVPGCRDYAAHEVRTFLPLAKSVILVTDGAIPIDQLPEGLKADSRRITELRGGDMLEDAALEDGAVLPVHGWWSRKVSRAVQALRGRWGETVGSRIRVNEEMRSSVLPLFAA